MADHHRHLGIVLAAGLLLGAAPALAALTVTSGKPINFSADPSDVVVELDTAGSCGSRYFHILRNATNFRELTAVALAAFSTNRTLTFFVSGCNADRNIVSHGYASQ